MTEAAAQPGLDSLKAEIKQLIVERLKLEVEPSSIADDQRLFGDGLGLDSIDALELVVAIEREFAVSVPEGKIDPDVFRTVRALAHWLEPRLGAVPAAVQKRS